MRFRTRLGGILGRAMERILGDPQPMGLDDWGNVEPRTGTHSGFIVEDAPIPPGWLPPMGLAASIRERIERDDPCPPGCPICAVRKHVEECE